MKKYAKFWTALAGVALTIAAPGVAPAIVPFLSPDLVQGVFGLATASGVYAVPNG